MLQSCGAAKAAPFSSAKVLHVGCGGNTLPEWLYGANETRLDIDPKWKPDICTSMTDLGDIGQFDVVLAHHCLEHLELSDANKALKEFSRVLVKGGAAFIVVPDLEGVVANDDVLFFAPCGPITGFDLIYGHSGYTKNTKEMCHKSGYVKRTFEMLLNPYFSKVNVRRSSHYNLIGVAIK